MNKKILLIDDDKMILKTLKKYLSKEGFRVITVMSGEEAINSINNEDFDLIISDIRMPGMGG